MNANELIEYLLTPAAQVGLIIGIAEIIKKIGLQTRWIPLIDIALGIISGIFVFGIMLDFGVAKGVIIGIAAGLAACGLFSGIKNIAEIGKKDEVTK